MPHRRKFTDEQVRAIRENPEGKSQHQLAREHGCAQMAIWRIQNRKSYKEIKDGRKNLR